MHGYFLITGIDPSHSFGGMSSAPFLYASAMHGCFLTPKYVPGPGA